MGEINFLELGNTTIALFAVAISAAALVVAIRANRKSSAFSKLNLTPHIDVLSSLGHDNRIHITIQNNGLGPATIKSAHFSDGSQKWNMDSGAELNDLFDVHSIRVTGRTLSAGTVILPGRDIVIVEYDRFMAEDENIRTAVGEIFSQTGYRIEYQSWDGSSFVEESPTSLKK